MEGTINAQENGVFYTSVPYEEGWKAYVDGKEGNNYSCRQRTRCILI